MSENNLRIQNLVNCIRELSASQELILPEKINNGEFKQIWELLLYKSQEEDFKKVFDENVKANHLFLAILKLSTQMAIENTYISKMFCQFSEYFFYASMLVAFKKCAPDAISTINIKIESEQLNLTVLEDVENLINNKFSQNLITPLIILEEILEIVNGESEHTLSEDVVSSINTLFGFSLNDWEISQKYSLFTLCINSIIAALSVSSSDPNYLIFIKELINYYFSDKVENLKECNLEFVQMMGEIEVDSIETN